MPPRKPQFRIDRLATLQQIAADRGGECLESQYIDSESQMAFRCARGHRWTTQARIVLNNGSWCPECSGARPLTLAGMQTIARAHGGECLSPAVGTTRTLLRWRCADGHEWEARPAKIREGSWCPRCAGFVDIGDMQAYAAERGGQCLSKVFITGNTLLKWQCAAGHRFSAIWRVVKLGRWCGYCRVNRPLKTIEDMRALAAAHGGECLSDTYLGSDKPLRWRCAAGHEWTTVLQNLGGGRWCSICGWGTLGIEFVRRLAWERGGRCLAEEYVNSSQRLAWECREGHRWWASTSNVYHRKSWCPVCGARRRGRRRARVSPAQFQTRGDAS